MNKTRILVVDDEPLNLAILCSFMENSEFDPVPVDNCAEAWELLQAQPDAFRVVLLDRIMPIAEMDGLELLRKIKATPSLQMLPVVMQTVANTSAQVQEGIDAGAYYYLTRPYESSLLLSILRAALDDRERHEAVHRTLEEQREALNSLTYGEFILRQIREVPLISSLIAQITPRPDAFVIGLAELLVNAIEHGNYGITYQEKQQLKLDNMWQEEIERRALLPENLHKQVKLAVRRTPDMVTVTIEDEGHGFDWNKYLDFDPVRAYDPNGRGIALARAMSFDSVEYLGCGNTVRATINVH